MSERAARSTLLKSALCLLLAASGAARAQQTQEPPPPEKPPRLKRERFGKSLERLKWDAEQKRATEKARAQKSAAGDEEDEVIRVETSLVVCDVLVLDAQGRTVKGLGREDFLITEDGRAQEVGAFALGDSANVPRSIVLILDYSSSMQPFLANSVIAAKILVDQLNPRDRMALVTDDVELLVNFTADKEQLRKKLDDLRRKTASEDFKEGNFGRSLQFSALMATLREMFDEEDTRPIVIFQTDGDELGWLRDSPVPIYEPGLAGMSPKSLQAMRARRDAKRPQFSLADVFKAAERSRATVYTVIPGVRLIGLEPGEQPVKAKALRRAFEASSPFPVNAYSDHMLEYMIRHWPDHQLALYSLSKLTGGWTNFLEEPSQAAGIYADIFKDIGNRYVVGFYPTNKERDGKRRRVQIEVRGHPEYMVWGRKSYYAPEP